MPALIPNIVSAGAPFTPSSVTTPSSLPVICHTTLSDDLSAGANIQYARCEPRASSTSAVSGSPACESLLPQQAPVEVQMWGRTMMHLHSEPDRVGFLKQNRPNALWVEMLDAVRSVNECPTGRSSREVTSNIESRMACLGVGAVAPQPSNAAPSPASLDGDAGDFIASPYGANETGIPAGTSEFGAVETLSLPSVYIRQEGYAPGTMAALEYDLGWRALSPSWKQVMPVIDEAMWQADPNPAMFCAVGRAVLPYLATDRDGYLLDEICASIVSFHMHAGGVADCLVNVTRTVERIGTDGQPKTVAAIELSDLVRQCSGTNWRDVLVAPKGQDALTRRREECARPTTSTSPGSAEDTQVPDI